MTDLEKKRIIYTLGTSRRSISDFIEILESFEISTVVDVRRFPRSRLPHFNREPLRAALKKSGIGYVYLGDDLGGYRKEGYEAYTASENFRLAVEALEEIAGEQTSVIVCAEKDPHKCHRLYIAEELSRRGWRVLNIIDIGEVVEKTEYQLPLL